MYNPLLELARVSLEICPEEAPLWPMDTECSRVVPKTRRMICCLGRWLVRLGQRLERIGAPAVVSLPQGR